MADKLTVEEISILRADLLDDGKWLPEGRERVKILCDMALASFQYVADGDTPAERAIKLHNAECDRLCGDKAKCGYKPYQHRRCPECPVNWKVDFEQSISNPSTTTGGADRT